MAHGQSNRTTYACQVSGSVLCGACMCGVRMHTHVWVLRRNIQNFSWAEQKVKNVALWQMVDPELGQSSLFLHLFILHPSLSLTPPYSPRRSSPPSPSPPPAPPLQFPSSTCLSCCSALEQCPLLQCSAWSQPGSQPRTPFLFFCNLSLILGPDRCFPNYKGQDSKNDLRRNVGKVVVNGRTEP